MMFHSGLVGEYAVPTLHLCCRFLMLPLLVMSVLKPIDTENSQVCYLTSAVIAHMWIPSAVISIIFLKGVQAIEASW